MNELESLRTALAKAKSLHETLANKSKLLQEELKKEKEGEGDVENELRPVSRI